MIKFAKFIELFPSAMHQLFVGPPQSEQDLTHRAKFIAGMSLGELADRLAVSVPTNLFHAKGWVGQLLEKALGATAGNLDQPDFEHLGIELKSLPVKANGLPQESTYICRVHLPIEEFDFYQSRVWRKCRHILWVPIEASAHIPVTQRKIGTALLWQPDKRIEAILKQDWEELNDMMRLGQFDRLSAHLGTYLQCRPKAANSQQQIYILNEEGVKTPIVPKGFYLRVHLTQHILLTHYALA